MNPLLRNGIYIVHISLGGLLLAYLLFDIRPSGLGMLGCLITPLIIVMVATWRSNRAQNKS